MTEQIPKKILVVDDEQDIVTYLTKILKQAKYDTLSAATGKKALELARGLKPDLIILDIVLPDILGGEVSHELGKDPSTSAIPIIFLSGLNTQEDENIMKEKTGNYYMLGKPIATEELLAVVKRALP